MVTLGTGVLASHHDSCDANTVAFDPYDMLPWPVRGGVKPMLSTRARAQRGPGLEELHGYLCEMAQTVTPVIN